MNALSAWIGQQLSKGPMRASEFMGLALYHPELGYYRQQEGPWGFEGKDYYTALDCGPLLGATLALRLQKAWERLDRPARFTVLEPGAGRGWLGRDLLAASCGAFAEALVYVHQDDNPAARRAAEQALATFLASGRARFEDEAVADPFIGAVVSNELFDALPAQPWRWDGGAWLMETLSAEGPVWLPGDPGEAGAWFAAQAEDGLHPGDGSAWREGLAPLVNRLGGRLQAGLFLAVDYGETAGRLLGKGADLRRYRGHTVDGRWWEDPGTCDLTADVDFTRLSVELDALAFRDIGHESLSRWIRQYAPLMDWEACWMELQEDERAQRMQNLMQLTLPGLMGERFRVLEAWKDRPSQEA